MTTAPAKPKARPIRIGFIALNDAAPIIVAQEHGFFQGEGLKVELTRAVGWATVRDKIIYKELDASHALGSMVISTTLGLNCVRCPSVTGFVLNSEGNCITLSEELWQRGVRDAKTLSAEIIRVRHERTFVFGVVFWHSSHHIQLRDWLVAGGIDPDKDVRIVVVPPAQLFRNLAAGTLDGYCVGDPWNSLAVKEGVGWCPAVSADLSPGHSEKVVMAREEFAETHPHEFSAMLRALSKAASLCDEPEFRPDLAKLLARPEYMDVNPKVTAAGLVGAFDYGHGRSLETGPLIHYHAGGVNEPTSEKAQWLIQGLGRHGLAPAREQLPEGLAQATFRTDLYQLAVPPPARPGVGRRRLAAPSLSA